MIPTRDLVHACTLAYLSGSVPYGLLLVRAVAGKDVRAQGSGNIGATNVARAAGKKVAVATLLLDAVKGLVPVLLAAHFWPGSWAPPLCALLAVVGHCFPIWLRGKGGKGVATGLGVALGLCPWAGLGGLCAFAVSFKLSRISSLSSLLGTLVSVALTAFLAPGASSLGLAAAATIILLRHRANLERLLQGRETKL